MDILTFIAVIFGIIVCSLLGLCVLVCKMEYPKALNELEKKEKELTKAYAKIDKLNMQLKQKRGTKRNDR